MRTYNQAKSLKDDTDRTFFEAWEDPNVGAMKITDGTYQDKNDTHESNENPNLASKRQGSFADVLNSNKPSNKSKFRSLLISEQVENADVVLPLATFTAAQQSEEAEHEGMEIKDAEDVVLKNGDLEAGKDGDREVALILRLK
ncbi:hypothetical protein Tco_1034261, partial [Tanacetum coccineum]